VVGGMLKRRGGKALSHPIILRKSKQHL